MVAKRDDIDPGGDQFFINSGGNARTAGGIFTIGDDQIELLPLNERTDGAANDLPPGLADDIADEEKTHYESHGRGARRCDDEQVKAERVK
jgi:hypothetical protein